MPAPITPADFKSGQKFPRINDDRVGVGRNRPRAHHFARSLESQIEHRGKIHIETQSPAGLADDLAVLAEELAVARSQNTSAAEGAGPVTLRKRSTLPPSRSTQVKQRLADVRLTILEQLVRLLRVDDIAGKQNHARRLNAA